VKRADYLRPLYADRPDRAGRDRLEILTALIRGPSFDPVYGPDIIQIPRTRSGGADLCSAHLNEWVAAREHGIGKAAFVTAAHGLDRHVGVEEITCRICPGRPAAHTELRLCQRHPEPVGSQEAGR
jgi:hypothetical protein